MMPVSPSSSMPLAFPSWESARAILCSCASIRDAWITVKAGRCATFSTLWGSNTSTQMGRDSDPSSVFCIDQRPKARKRSRSNLFERRYNSTTSLPCIVEEDLTSLEDLQPMLVSTWQKNSGTISSSSLSCSGSSLFPMAVACKASPQELGDLGAERCQLSWPSSTSSNPSCSGSTHSSVDVLELHKLAEAGSTRPFLSHNPSFWRSHPTRGPHSPTSGTCTASVQDLHKLTESSSMRSEAMLKPSHDEAKPTETRFMKSEAMLLQPLLARTLTKLMPRALHTFTHALATKNLFGQRSNSSSPP